jgi:hypothetical protein
MLPDPTLLEVMNHLSWRPPALVRDVGNASLDVERAAYEGYLRDTEREIKKWAAHGLELREELWRRGLEAADREAYAKVLSEMIELYEDGIRREAREIERLRKRINRDTRAEPPATRAVAKKMNDKLMTLAESFFREGQEFALFLRAARAEFDPKSRGGETFENPVDLERYLKSAVA